jgi:hypothetical protein
MAMLGGWNRQRPPDGKYLPDEPASFAKSMNSSVKRNLFQLANPGVLSCRATNAIEVIGNEMNFSLAKH